MEWYRGDRDYVSYQYTVGGSPIDITGYIFTLTVSTIKNPIDVTTQIFQSVGGITDAINGKVSFFITEDQIDVAPGKYYYDIQVEKPNGNVRTLQKDVFKVIQDITKDDSGDDYLLMEDGEVIWTEDNIALTLEG